jgi:hypothetical protein
MVRLSALRVRLALRFRETWLGGIDHEGTKRELEGEPGYFVVDVNYIR